MGDVVVMKPGDGIPADGLLYAGEGVKSNESGLTGEPDDLTKKADVDCFLYSRCLLASLPIYLPYRVNPNNEQKLYHESLACLPDCLGLRLIPLQLSIFLCSSCNHFQEMRQKKLTNRLPACMPALGSFLLRTKTYKSVSRIAWMAGLAGCPWIIPHRKRRLSRIACVSYGMCRLFSSPSLSINKKCPVKSNRPAFKSVKAVC